MLLSEEIFDKRMCDTFIRSLHKKEYLMIIRDNFSYFSLKLYVVTPHLNCLNKTVQMRGHNICLYAELTKIIPNFHQLLLLISVYDFRFALQL